MFHIRAPPSSSTGPPPKLDLVECTSHIATPAPGARHPEEEEKTGTASTCPPRLLSPVHTLAHTHTLALQIDRRGKSKPHLLRPPSAQLRVRSTRSAAKGRRRRTPSGAHAAPGDNPGAGGRGPADHNRLHRAWGPSPKAASQGRLVFQSLIPSFIFRSSSSGWNFFSSFSWTVSSSNTQEKEEEGEEKKCSGDGFIPEKLGLRFAVLAVTFHKGHCEVRNRLGA